MTAHFSFVCPDCSRIFTDGELDGALKCRTLTCRGYGQEWPPPAVPAEPESPKTALLGSKVHTSDVTVRLREAIAQTAQWMEFVGQKTSNERQFMLLAKDVAALVVDYLVKAVTLWPRIIIDHGTKAIQFGVVIWRRDSKWQPRNT